MPLSASDAALLTVQDLQLCSLGSPSHLEALRGAAPGGQNGYQILFYHRESQTLAHNVSASPGTLSDNSSDLLPGSEHALEVPTWAANLQAKPSIYQWTGKASARRGPGGRPVWKWGAVQSRVP